MIFFSPNGAIWQDQLKLLRKFSKSANQNILCVNYRATGLSTSKRATSFSELFSDGEHGVKYLRDLGVQLQNMTFHGHSLGGASALYLGAKHQVRTIVQNTFSKISLVARELLRTDIIETIFSIYKTYKNALLTEQKSKIKRLLFSLKDFIGSPLHLAFRVSYFFLSLLSSLIQGKFKEAGLDALEMGKTLLLDTVLTITGLISLVASPFTDKINRFNGKLNSFQIDRSAVQSFLQSSLLAFMVERILETSGWNVDGTSSATTLGKKLLVIQAPNDAVLRKSALLTTALSARTHTVQIHSLGDSDDHNSFDLEKSLKFINQK